MKAIERRLQRLESEHQSAGHGDPVPMYQWFAEHGHEAPEPLDGERFQEWLKRVPSDSLEALLVWSDANVQTRD